MKSKKLNVNCDTTMLQTDKLYTARVERGFEEIIDEEQVQLFREKVKNMLLEAEEEGIETLEVPIPLHIEIEAIPISKLRRHVMMKFLI